MMKLNNIYLFLRNNYYVFVFFLYSITIIKNDFPVGLASTLLMITIFIIKFFLWFKKHGIIKSKYNFIILYFVWCLMSFIWYINTNLPIDIYVQAISNSLFPLFFVFFAEKNKNLIFLRKFLNSYLLVGLIGVVLLFMKPTWYIVYCLERGYDYRRLSSFLGSINMGCLGAVALIVSMFLFIKFKGKKYKIQYVLSLFFSVISMQRSAWIVVIVSLIVVHYFVFFKFQIIKLRYLCLEIVCLSFFIFIFRMQIFNVFSEWYDVHNVSNKGLSIKEAFSRSSQWRNSIADSNLIIGNGFGSKGHKAQAFGVTNYVADGSWILILCETGVIGFLSFLHIYLKCLFKSIEEYKKYFISLAVIFIFGFQAIGSNVFELQVLAPIYWFVIGIVLNHE